MRIYTIGFAGKTAEQFFEILKRHGIKRLIDVRLKNNGQLAGFARASHLEYLLRELCGAEYRHEPLLAPDEDLLKALKPPKRSGLAPISWPEYQKRFVRLLKARNVDRKIDKSMFGEPTVLLCSEPTADHCHRRLVAEYLGEAWDGVEIVHV